MPRSPFWAEVVGRNPTTVIHWMVRQAKASPAIQGPGERTVAPIRRPAAAALPAPRDWPAGRTAAARGSDASVTAVTTHHSRRQDATCRITALPARPAKAAIPVDAPQ